MPNQQGQHVTLWKPFQHRDKLKALFVLFIVLQVLHYMMQLGLQRFLK